MNVSLTQSLDAYVREKVESGRYNSASEVVREALRLMQERDEDRLHARDQIQAGLEAIASGEVSEGTAAELLAQAIARSRKRVKSTGADVRAS